MKLEDFDPPVLNEAERKLTKTPAQYKQEIFGDNFERMTPSKLKWLIALSGPVNDKYYGKGATRGTKNGVETKGPDIDNRKFPKKPKKDEKGKIIGPGDEPSKPFPGQCLTGDDTCIARVAKGLVDDYFQNKPAGQPLNRPMHVKDTQRKRAKMPKLRLGKDGRPVYQAPRPTGTYAATGKKRGWGGVTISTGRGASPMISKKEVSKLTRAAPEPKEPKKRPKVKPGRRRRSGGLGGIGDKKKPGKSKAAKPSPESMQSAEQARRMANKRRSLGGGARSGPQRPKKESRNYISFDNTDENIIQALYG